MRKVFIGPLLSLALVVAFAAASPSAGQEAAGGGIAGKAGTVRVTTIADRLAVPWSTAFLPGGDALVSERNSGRLLRISASGGKRAVGELPVTAGGEGGLLGIALSPNYADDHLVYAYYSTERDNRVVRFRLGDADRLDTLVTGIPRGDNHNGGRIAFGPDRLLYISTGDAGDRERSQDRGSLGGKILRVRPDGSVPEGNPFPGSRVYSYGHRNVQGLAWDADGRLFASELGQDTYDEVNRIRAGGNYGWPRVEGKGGDPRYIDPITVFRPANASPSGVAIPRRLKATGWNGDLFMAALRGESLWRMELDAEGRVTDRQRLLEGRYGRIRHVAAAPDGTLWILTSNGQNDRVLRVTRTGG